MTSIHQQLIGLIQVALIDLALAGDNAIVIGLAASRVAERSRAKVIFLGIAGAVVLRVLLAGIALELLAIVGLTLAGGILLLWVCWKMYRELWRARAAPAAALDAPMDSTAFWQAVVRIVVADLSMSLDNVLAVAGAAKGSLLTLVTGLGLSIVLMAVAATYVTRLLARYPWISWVGLAIVLYVALEMIWHGAVEVGAHVEGV